ncbi:type VI secretion system tube protein Hcp [Bordetella bronchialis]|uniref:Hcp1 family type VI secretion system effector n=1 Tax=Bordetella bronchialis TaxID=463025 RepID=A0ABM6CWA2_9BORD|nr:type VI secretion system tube protein Hcp [Bordetella bronchialis]ANN68398.1 hypothetical protein BAU06_20720 [Bordetella bronchialis]
MADTTVITMKMDGISGDSQIKGADGHADILSYSYSASIPIEGRGPGLSGAGATYVTPIALHKKTCSATPPTEQQFYSGKPIKTVEINEYKADGESQPKPFVKITLTNARINSYQVSPGGVEDLSMTFETVKREYFKQNTESSALEQAGSTTFDLLTKAVS